MASSPPSLRALPLLGALLPLALLLGCGHPATEEECRLILRKSAELELEGKLDRASGVLEKELRVVEEELRDTMMKQCVGRRIRESALACVRTAKSREQLLEECLR